MALFEDVTNELGNELEPTQDEVFLANLAGEFSDRLVAGESPKMSEYLDRCPPRLRDEFRELANMYQLAHLAASVRQPDESDRT